MQASAAGGRNENRSRELKSRFQRLKTGAQRWAKVKMPLPRPRNVFARAQILLLDVTRGLCAAGGKRKCLFRDPQNVVARVQILLLRLKTGSPRRGWSGKDTSATLKRGRASSNLTSRGCNWTSRGGEK